MTLDYYAHVQKTRPGAWDMWNNEDEKKQMYEQVCTIMNKYTKVWKRHASSKVH